MIRYKTIHQLIKFSIIGIGNGAIDLLALNILLAIWHGHTVIALTIINSVAYGLAVLNSYYWNSRITFRREASRTRQEKIKFVVQAAVSLVISNIVFVLFTDLLGYFAFPLWIIHNVSKGLSMLLSSACSFLLMRYLVYK